MSIDNRMKSIQYESTHYVKQINLCHQLTLYLSSGSTLSSSSSICQIAIDLTELYGGNAVVEAVTSPTFHIPKPQVRSGRQLLQQTTANPSTVGAFWMFKQVVSRIQRDVCFLSCIIIWSCTHVCQSISVSRLLFAASLVHLDYLDIDCNHAKNT